MYLLVTRESQLGFWVHVSSLQRCQGRSIVERDVAGCRHLSDRPLVSCTKLLVHELHVLGWDLTVTILARHFHLESAAIVARSSPIVQGERCHHGSIRLGALRDRLSINVEDK